MSEQQEKACASKVCHMELEAGVHWWCSCGLSGHLPLCDGSHKGTGKAPKKFVVTMDQTLTLCNCRLTHGPPFCDGSGAADPPSL